jgi:hypothetical protein
MMWINRITTASSRTGVGSARGTYDQACNRCRSSGVVLEPVIRENISDDCTAARTAYLSRPRQRPAANRNPQARSDARTDASIAYGVMGHELAQRDS